MLFICVGRDELEVAVHAKTENECDSWVEAINRCITSLRHEEEAMFHNNGSGIRHQISMLDEMGLDDPEGTHCHCHCHVTLC